MNIFYWKLFFKLEWEEEYLSLLLSQKIGDIRYFGDFVFFENYFFVVFGNYGLINFILFKYIGVLVEKFIYVEVKFFVLWICGVEDQIVLDNFLFDFGIFGKLGLIFNYFGEDVYLL